MRRMEWRVKRRSMVITKLRLAATMLGSWALLAACDAPHGARNTAADALPPVVGANDVESYALPPPHLACAPDPSAFGWTPAPGLNEWIDPATCHRVVRLSRLPGRDFSSLYFNQNAFTASGDKLVFQGQDATPGNGLWSLDIAESVSLGTGTVRKVLDLGGEYGFPVVARKTREVFAVKGGVAEGPAHSIVAVDLDSLAERTIFTFPATWDFSPDASLGFAGLTLSADGSTIAGAYTSGVAAVVAQLPLGASKTDVTNAIAGAALPTLLFAVDTNSGAFRQIYGEAGWFDHTQFSPTDPTLLMFDHEGFEQPRIWLVDTLVGSPTYFRGYDATIGDQPTHEFFSNGGTWVWFDDFTSALPDKLVAKRISDGQLVSYALTGAQRSRHYNISHDSTHFAADGNPPIPGINPHPAIMLFTPQAGGTMVSEKLCSIENNDFETVEPNVRFTPDDQWVVFSSTAPTGTPNVYAVAVNAE